MRYFDASALVKRYLREQGSAEVRRLLSSDTPATSRLSQVEIASALMRRAREGAYPATDRDRALAALEKDFASILVVELTPQIAAQAQQLLLRHELRAGDAIQLASGLFLQEQLSEPVPFVAFDGRLGEAARREGLAKA
jgi:predicted nucleic acid-binding protein